MERLNLLTAARTWVCRPSSNRMQNHLSDIPAVFIGAAAVVLASIENVNAYLQMIVLILTIIFLVLGCYLRGRKIRGEGGGDGEE